MSASVQPHRWQPTRFCRPRDSPGKNTGVGCHFLLQCMKVKSESGVAQLCLTLRDPTDCSPPGSSIHGIFQARALEWGAIAFWSLALGLNKSSVPDVAIRPWVPNRLRLSWWRICLGSLSAMQETWVRSLGCEDPLEKGKAAHSSILAWRIPWTIQSMGSQRVGHNWATFTFPTPNLVHGLPRWLSVKNPPARAGDEGSILGLGRSLEKEMATHSAILTWKRSLGGCRVEHDWVTHTQSQSSPSLLGAGVPMQHSQQPFLNTEMDGACFSVRDCLTLSSFQYHDSSKSAL